MKRKYYTEILSFSAADVVTGEKLSLINAKGCIGTPKPMTKEEYNKVAMSFGMWGGSGNTNQNTPNATVADVIPKPEDFMNFPFRFISETIVGGGSWKATDFAVNKPLKPSLPKIDGKTIFSDHVSDSENWAGIVTEPYWQEAFTADDGNPIPAGINGYASIDVKTNFRLARGIAAGAIGSNSVTTAFNWEPSHKFTEMGEFYDKLGTFSADGQMVRRMVTEILDYFESSMLWLGADPFSKKLDDKGQPIKVDHTCVYFSKLGAGEKYLFENEKLFVVKVDNAKEIISLSKSNEKNKFNIPKKEKNMKPFLIAFLTAFGTKLGLSFSTVEGDDITPEQEAEAIACLNKLALESESGNIDPETQKIVNFTKALQTYDNTGKLIPFTSIDKPADVVVLTKTDKAALDTKVSTLQQEKTALESMATLGETTLKLKREETLKLYSLSVEGKVDPSVEKNINEASDDLLNGMLKQYGKDNVFKFKPTCTKCNTSDSIEMRSTVDTGLPGNKSDDSDNGYIPSSEDFMGKFGGSRLFGGR